jgi:tetratricopeptide (TPR) repeat protein
MHTWVRLVLALSFALLAPLAAAQDAVLGQAKQLMDKREAAAAYKLLKPLEDERAGQPDFDYLLGIAALDIGRNSEAVFALERVLAVNPNHVQARAEIARAYAQLGEMETARREFESVRKQPMPAEAQATIQKYLDAIEQAQASNRTSFSGFVEFGLGYDSNVNSGTATSQIAIPALPGLGPATLNPLALKQSDSFGQVAFGGNVRHPVNPSVALLAGFDGYQRFHQDTTEFEQGHIGGNVAIEYNWAANKLLLGLQGQQLYVDWSRFRDSLGIIGQWQRQVGSAGVFTGYVQYARLEYPGQEIRNADRAVGGVAYAHAFSGAYSPVAFVGLYYGHENERDSTRPDLGHRLTGFRIGGQLNVSERLAAFGFASYEERDYGGATPGFLENRADRQTDFRIGVTYRPNKLWTVTPQFAYTENKSNVPFTDYDRAQAFITVRRDFR